MGGDAERGEGGGQNLVRFLFIFSILFRDNIIETPEKTQSDGEGGGRSRKKGV